MQAQKEIQGLMQNVEEVKQEHQNTWIQLEGKSAELAETQEKLASAMSAVKACEAERDEVKSQLENETRRLNGNYLMARSEKKEAVEMLESEQAKAKAAADAAAQHIADLNQQLELKQQEMEKCEKAKLEADARVEKEKMKRATAVVESEAERSLREATESSKIFDNVRADVVYDQKERSDLERTLDAATYRLMEVSNQNRAILGQSQRYFRGQPQ